MDAVVEDQKGDPGLVASDSRTDNLFQKLSGLFSRALIPVALSVFAAPFIALLFYSSLNTDDFVKATLAACTGTTAVSACVRLPNVLTMAWTEYSSIETSGRWLAALLESLAMSKSNLIASYGWLLLLVMLTNIAALSYFFATILRVPRTRALLAAGVFYAAWLASVASPAENVFWLTGAMEYQLPLSAMLILAGLISKPRHTIFSYIALVALAIAIPAQHEIAGAFLLPCLLAGVVAARILKLPTPQWWLGLGLVALSFGAVMLSPAMAFKLSLRPRIPWDVAHVLPYAKRVVDHGINWMMNPAILLCAFCMPLLLRTREDSSSGSEYRPPKWLALAALGAMCVLLAEFASAEMSSGYAVMPPRTVGWFQFVFSLLLVCVILIGIPEISQIKFSPSSRIGISMLLVVSLLGSGNFHSAEKDLRGPARPWWEGSVARLRQRGSSLRFEPLPPRPTLFKYTSLAMEPASSRCWVNQCMALYLGAKTVAVEDFRENPDGCGSDHDPVAENRPSVTRERQVDE
jgi:hypothetical protein